MTTTSPRTTPDELSEFTGRIPDGPFDEVDLATKVELRVHGVGGTPPTEMLDDPAPQQVSGDAIAGVWRGHDPSPSVGAVEAYSWGGLTEKSWRSALWLVVLPFAMVNVAGWMAVRSRGVYRGFVRLVGLALTAIYVEFAAVIGMDFASYQCAAKEGCLTAGWWVIGLDGITHGGAQRAVVGAALPLVVVLGLGLLTWVSRRRYEQWELAVPPGADGPGNADTPAEVGLTHERFWRGQGYAAHLAEIHLFVGMALPALLLSITASTTTDSTWAPALTVVIVVALVVGGLAGMVTRVRDRLGRHVSLVLGAVLFVAAAVAAWSGTPVGPDGVGPLPGILPTFGAVLCVFFGGAFVLLGIGLTIRPPAGETGTRFRHAYTPFAVTVVAGLLGSAVLAGAALWVAGTFGDTVGVGDPAASRAAILYPQPFEAIARTLVLTAAVAAVVGAVAAIRAARSVDSAPWQRLQAALKGEVDHGGRPADASWEKGVKVQLRVPAAARAGAEWSLWTLGGGGALAMAGYGVFWLMHSRDAADRFRDLQAIPMLPPLSLCIFLLTLLPLGAIWVMRQSLRKVAVRKLVSIAWDVATFWPRSFHPLCPPCYAERAVPEIQTRLLRIWANGGAVELLGHSQGAVLVTAAVASLPAAHVPEDGRLTLVTYGNPARRLYARHFPAYVHDELLRKVLSRVGGDATWTNFYRDTDPIGHRVWPAGSDHTVDAYLPDPATDRSFPGDAAPAVRGHAERGYRRQTPFVARARELAGRLRT